MVINRFIYINFIKVTIKRTLRTSDIYMLRTENLLNYLPPKIAISRSQKFKTLDNIIYYKKRIKVCTEVKDDQYNSLKVIRALNTFVFLC